MLTIKEIRELLDYFFKSNVESLTANQMGDILNILSEPNQLRYLIKSIIDDKDLIRQAVSDSESHRLGFDKLCLLSSKSFSSPSSPPPPSPSPIYYQLRLHIWWPSNIDNRKEGIHNHKFNFASKIIKGAISEQIYERCQGGGVGGGVGGEGKESNMDMIQIGTFYEYLNHPLSHHRFDCFEYKGLTPLRIVSDTVRPEGTMYTLHHETFHNAVPHDHRDCTVTLFLKTGNIKPADTIFERQPLFLSTHNTNNKSDTKDNETCVDNNKLSEFQYKNHLLDFLLML